MPLVRVRKKVKEELKEYAESRGVTLGTAVRLLLEEGRDRRVLIEILKTLCRIEEILKDLSTRAYYRVESEEEGEKVLTTELPSFVRRNPWIEVLRGRRSVQKEE